MKKRFIFSVSIFLILCIICLGVASLVYVNQSQVVVYQLPLQQKWDFEAQGQIRTTPIVHYNKVLFVGGGELYNLDASTGRIIWSTSLPDRIIANPVIHNDTVIVSYVEGARAFDVITGEQLWEQKTSAYPYRPVVANDNYIVFRAYSAMVHDIKTGELIWYVGEPDLEPLVRAVALDDNNLYVFLEDQIHLYDIESRQLLWQDSTVEEWSSYQGLLTENMFYLKRNKGGIVAYDPQQRKIIWRRDDLSSSPYPISKQDGILFLDSRGGVPTAISAQTGETIWTANELTKLDDYQTPLVTDDIIYVRGVFMNRVYALNKDTGEMIGYIRQGVPDIISTSAEHSLGPVQYKEMIIFPVGKQLLAFGEE